MMDVRTKRALKAYSIVAVVLFLAVWEYAVIAHWANPLFLSSPSQILMDTYHLFATGTMRNDIRVSGDEFLLGFVLSVVVGVILGILAGWYPKLEATISPFVSALYATPRIAFMPLLFVWLGVGLASKVAVVFLLAFFPILLNTIAGVKEVSTEFLEVARLYGGNNLDIFRTVALPSAVPFIATGLRLAVGQGLIAVFVAELYSANSGVGFLIAESGNLFRVTDVFAGVLILAMAGVILMSLMGRLEAHFQSWRANTM